jgi:hypothetical protein
LVGENEFWDDLCWLNRSGNLPTIRHAGFPAVNSNITIQGCFWMLRVVDGRLAVDAGKFEALLLRCGAVSWANAISWRRLFPLCRSRDQLSHVFTWPNPPT